MADGYWAIRKWQAGAIGETIKYWVPGKRPDRMTRKAKQEMKKAAQNAATAVKVCARLLNENFREGDVLLSLDYNQQAYYAMTKDIMPGMDEEDRSEMVWKLARKNLQNTIRRAQYQAKKQGVELRYISFTSDLDEQEGSLVQTRVHHHLIADAQSADCIAAAWRDGGADLQHLSSQPDYTPIAAYLLRQVRHCEDAKKYICSRNLVRPVPVDRIAKGGGQIRPPKGAVLLDQGAYRPGEPQYIRYILPWAVEDAETEERRGIRIVKSTKQHRRATATQ